MTRRKRFLLDINVVLDVLLDREPHARYAAMLWAEIEGARLEGFLPAHAFTTVYYIAERARGSSFARDVVDALLSLFQVVPVDERILRQAFALRAPDFEDAVSAACATACGADAIVTRDPGGFPDSAEPVLAPIEAVAVLRLSDESR